MTSPDVPTESAAGDTIRKRFGHGMRLHGQRVFQRVFQAKAKKHAGSLTVFAAPNEVGHPRLGLSVPRRVGTAVRRNRIKRRIREAFRLQQHELPPGLDLVVAVRPHEPMLVAEYQPLLAQAAEGLRQVWARRQRRAGAKQPAAEERKAGQAR